MVKQTTQNSRNQTSRVVSILKTGHNRIHTVVKIWVVLSVNDGTNSN